jgi:VWFA-related protein
VPLRPATLAIVALSVTTLAAQQKPERYTERVEVSRVLIDARVLDDRGHAIDDLQVDDFTVKIGGRAARVESIEWVSGGLTADAAPLDSAAFDFASDQRRGRLIVFVFQKSLERSRIVGFMRMLIEARGLLDRLTPQDRVAVLSFDSHLQIWLDFTNDFDRVRRVFQHGILFERPAAVQESAGLSLLQRLDSRSAKRTYSIEGALRRIGDALEYLPGVKSVVLVGHGFGRLGLNGVSMENEYDAMRDALQRARASVFSLDVTEADYHSLEAGLQLVAADTGGFFARTHIFTDRAIESLVGALAGHYALFIEQPSLKRGTHRIEVELTRRKGRVLANRTYVIATRDQSSVPLHAASSSHSRAGSSCPTTPPGEVRFVPPPPYPPSAPFPDAFWHGTASLWTMLPVNGQWTSLPRGDHGYRQKVFVWRPGYDGRSEQWPHVTVTGRRIDGSADALVAEEATNAHHRDFGGWAMLSTVEVPMHGCWELTAVYGASSVTFVVSVVP